MIRVRWTPLAVAQLEEIQDYIVEDDPLAAYSVVTKIIDRVEFDLPVNPEMGRAGQHVPGTRELAIASTPFIVVYRLHEDGIDIVRVRHGAQRWPPEQSDR